MLSLGVITALDPQAQKQMKPVWPRTHPSTKCGRAFPQTPITLPVPDPWAGPAESPGQISSGRKLQSNRVRRQSWHRVGQEALERGRLTHLILISWELTALKAQVSHIMPAVKINSPFNSNLNHKTGSHQKAKITQLLHSKRISLKAGPHWKHHGGGPFIYGKKIIRRQWRCTDTLQLLSGSNTLRCLRSLFIK